MINRWRVNRNEGYIGCLLSEWHYWMQRADEEPAFLVTGNFIFQKGCKRKLWTTSTSEQYFLWHDFIHPSSLNTVVTWSNFTKYKTPPKTEGVLESSCTSHIVWYIFHVVIWRHHDTTILQWWHNYITNTISLYILGGERNFYKTGQA